MICQRLSYDQSYDEITSQLSVSPRTVMQTFQAFLNTGEVKHCRFGPTGSVILCPHEKYIIMDCLLWMSQIQLHEMPIIFSTLLNLVLVQKRYAALYIRQEFLVCKLRHSRHVGWLWERIFLVCNSNIIQQGENLFAHWIPWEWLHTKNNAKEGRR